MTKYLTLDDFNVRDKTVLVRVDFNSPVDPKTKKVLDDSRIRAHGETTIRELATKGARIRAPAGGDHSPWAKTNNR